VNRAIEEDGKTKAEIAEKLVVLHCIEPLTPREFEL
jgi:hypothetical protein